MFPKIEEIKASSKRKIKEFLAILVKILYRRGKRISEIVRELEISYSRVKNIIKRVI